MGNLGIIRMSDIQGDTQTGPLRQRQEITAKFTGMGIREEDISWAEDLDVSAFHVPPLKRPELRREFERLAPGSNVVFYRLDRFVRRVFPDFADMVSYSTEHRLNLVSATQAIDLSGPMGLMQATLLAFLGQMESEATSARVKNSQDYLRRVGRWRGGRIPYGYMPVKVEGKPGKYLEADPTTVPVVWDIVARIIAGESANAVCTYLNELAIPTPIDRNRQLMEKPRTCQCGHDEHAGPCVKHHKCMHRTTPGGKKLHEYDECSAPCPEYRPRLWIQSSLREVLRNPNLLGHTVEGGRARVLLDNTGTPVMFAPGIIVQEDWDKVQARLDERTRVPRRTSTSSMLLNIAQCDCGTPLYKAIMDSGPPRKTTYEYYREAMSGRCGKNRSILCSSLDTLVSDEMVRTLGHLYTMERLPPSARRSELKAELKTVQAQLLLLYKERLEGERLRDNHQELNDELEKRNRELKEQLESDDSPEETWRKTDVLFADKWESMTVKERRMYLLDAGVKVVAVRGRMPAINFQSRPPLKRSMIVANDGDLWAYIYLGNMGEMLRHASGLPSAIRET